MLDDAPETTPALTPAAPVLPTPPERPAALTELVIFAGMLVAAVLTVAGVGLVARELSAETMDSWVGGTLRLVAGLAGLFAFVCLFAVVVLTLRIALRIERRVG